MCKFCFSVADPFKLAEPNAAMLDGYRAALGKGWSPDNVVDRSTAELDAIAHDPVEFINAKSDATNANVVGRTFTLPDGTQVPRLPVRDRWMWDGEFVGRIGLRYLPGTNELPASALGHIGYAVVPWKRGNGYAKRALAHMLAEAQEVGLTEVSLTCDPDNVASQKVILSNGGRLESQFSSDHHGAAKLRYIIDLA
jgi:predicted acetyltransferase